MKVLVKKVGKKPEVREIEDKLEVYQKIVDGYIEVIPFAENVLCICNAEGKLNNLPANFILFDDVIVGDVIFISASGEDFCGLDERQIKLIERIFQMKK